MTHLSKINFACQLIGALAILFAANQSAEAQFGGSFAPPIVQSSSTVQGQSAQSQSQFNSVPFKFTGQKTSPAKPNIAPGPTTRVSQNPRILNSVSSFNSGQRGSSLKSNTQSIQAKTSNKPFQLPTTSSGFGPNAPAKKVNNPKVKIEPISTQLPGHPSINPMAKQEKGSSTSLLPGQKNSTPPSNGFTKPSSFPRQSLPNFGGQPMISPPLTSEENGSSGSGRLPNHVDCPTSTVSFIDDINLPALEAGEIKTLDFKEGDFVPSGQIIGRIDDTVYQMALETAQLQFQIAYDKASNKVASMAARKKWEVAKIEASKTARLAARGSKSESEKMMAEYTRDIALLEMQKTDDDRKNALAEAQLARKEMKQVQARIARHTLKADFDAYVVKTIKKKGEYVQMGEEVLRLARMDRVWVQSVVNYKKLNAHELKGRKVTVTVKLAREKETTFEGVIKFVGLERQGPELLMVKAEVVNRPINDHWVLHPEAEVQMRIHVSDPPMGSSARMNR